MSAIWGVWRHDGSPGASAAVARMGEALRLFGEGASWADGPAGLGRAIAYTLPEDAGDAQPVALPNGDRLVASVRLDDRAALCRLLRVERERPDSALLAAAWQRWGPETPRHLTGEFSFAVWQPGEQRLFCACDHLGLRSLYYCEGGGQFAFATLARALLVERVLQPDGLAAALALFPEQAGGTIYRGVRRLAAGHSLTATARGVTVSRYWDPEAVPAVRLGSDGAYAEAFRELLDKAVADRLRASVTVGTMLSGGFDSAAVTASAALQLAARGQRLPAFTGVPDPAFRGPVPADRFADESGHAGAVAALYPNVEHALVTPLAEFPLAIAAANFPRVDYPGGALSLIGNGAAMAAAHRRAGVRVVLNGVLGNLSISYTGLPLMPRLVRAGHWARWFREARGLTRHSHFRWPGVCALSFGPQAPPLLWRLVQRRRAGAGSGLRRYALLHPRYFESGRLLALAAERGFDPYCRPAEDGLRLRAQLLTRRNNAIHNAAAEFRDPTGDRRLIEFCLGIPEEQFLRDGVTKHLIRSALRDRLPAVVLDEWRKGLCGADWALRIAPYRERFREAIADIATSALARETLDIPRLRAMTEAWPTHWDTPAISTSYGMGYCQAVQMGAFIRWVEQGGP